MAFEFLKMFHGKYSIGCRILNDNFVFYGVVNVLLVGGVIWCARAFWKLWRFWYLARKIGGPKTIPFFGNALLFWGKHQDILNKVDNLIRSFPSPFNFWFGPYLYVVVSDPKDIQIVLSDTEETFKDPVMKCLEPFIGRGLITESGPIWKLHRKIIGPTFNIKLLEKYTKIFNEKSHILTNNLREQIDKNNVKQTEMIDWLSLCTVDVLCATIMGSEIHAQNTNNDSIGNPYKEFIKANEQMYHLISDRMFKAWLHFDFIHKFTDNYRQVQATKQTIDRFINGIIQKKRQMIGDWCYDEEDTIKYQTTLEQLLNPKCGKMFNDKELRDEMYTLFTAGQDTTALIAAFAILMLGIHQDVQEKAYEEIDLINLEGKSTFNISWDSYNGLKYLECIIKETLRLFPIAPLMVRQLQNEMQLSKHRLPAGAGVVISAFHAHRHPEHWTDPECFIPERFAQNDPNRHPFAFIPFSYGLRSCLGQKYAMLCLKTILAHLIHEFRFNTNTNMENLQLMSDISVRSVNGYQVQIVSRKNRQ